MIREKKKIPPSIWAALIVLGLILIIMVFADQLAAHDPTAIDLTLKFHPADRTYPFGTDDYGRCVFCRCIYAVRNSIGIAFTIELASVMIGMILGIPIFVVSYAYASRAINRKLEKRGFSTSLSDYKVDKYRVKKEKRKKGGKKNGITGN